MLILKNILKLFYRIKNGHPMFPMKTVLDFNLSEFVRFTALQEALETKGFTFVGHGKDRFTFLSPNRRYVLKFPRWDSGLWANEREAKLWKETLGRPDLNGIVYAPCRLLKDGILIMWAVTSAYGETYGCSVARKAGLDYSGNGDDLPNWVSSVDCSQVGILHNGKLAAYDYGG